MGRLADCLKMNLIWKFLAQEMKRRSLLGQPRGERRASGLFRKSCSPGNVANGWRGLPMITHSGHLDLIIATFADNKWPLSEAGLMTRQWQKLISISGQSRDERWLGNVSPSPWSNIYSDSWSGDYTVLSCGESLGLGLRQPELTSEASAHRGSFVLCHQEN